MFAIVVSNGSKVKIYAGKIRWKLVQGGIVIVGLVAGGDRRHLALSAPQRAEPLAL